MQQAAVCARASLPRGHKQERASVPHPGKARHEDANHHQHADRDAAGQDALRCELLRLEGVEGRGARLWEARDWQAWWRQSRLEWLLPLTTREGMWGVDRIVQRLLLQQLLRCRTQHTGLHRLQAAGRGAARLQACAHAPRRDSRAYRCQDHSGHNLRRGGEGDRGGKRLASVMGGPAQRACWRAGCSRLFWAGTCLLTLAPNPGSSPWLTSAQSIWMPPSRNKKRRPNLSTAEERGDDATASVRYGHHVRGNTGAAQKHGVHSGAAARRRRRSRRSAGSGSAQRVNTACGRAGWHNSRAPWRRAAQQAGHAPERMDTKVATTLTAPGRRRGGGKGCGVEWSPTGV